MVVLQEEMVLRWLRALAVSHKNGNKGLGVVSETGQNGGFIKKGPLQG